jgi:hypothetical protein
VDTGQKIRRTVSLVKKEEQHADVKTAKKLKKTETTCGTSKRTSRNNEFQECSKKDCIVCKAKSKSDLQKRLIERVGRKYASDRTIYNAKVINDLIYNENTHIVSVFKDYLIYDDRGEFMKRFYSSSEIQPRIQKITAYYSQNSRVFPCYFGIDERKYMFKNIKRKQKAIDGKNQPKEDKATDDLFNTKFMQELNKTDSILGKTLRDENGNPLSQMQSYIKQSGKGNSKNIKELNLQQLVENFIIADSKTTINLSQEKAAPKSRNAENIKKDSKTQTITCKSQQKSATKRPNPFKIASLQTMRSQSTGKLRPSTVKEKPKIVKSQAPTQERIRRSKSNVGQIEPARAKNERPSTVRRLSSGRETQKTTTKIAQTPRIMTQSTKALTASKSKPKLVKTKDLGIDIDALNKCNRIMKTNGPQTRTIKTTKASNPQNHPIPSNPANNSSRQFKSDYLNSLKNKQPTTQIAKSVNKPETKCMLASKNVVQSKSKSKPKH